MTQLTNLRLYNKDGVIDTEKPFSPLGIPSSKNSYLIFGSKDWLNKSISEVNIKLTWDDTLPKDFAAYFSTYSWVLGHQSTFFNNTSFKVTFSILKNGEWIPLKAESCSLFKENLNDGSVLPYSEFNFKFDEKLLLMGSDENGDSYEYGITQDGFMRMQLVQPEYGFGASIYAKVVSAVAKHNANNIFSEEADKGLILPPNSPYIPKAVNIEVSVNVNI